MKTFENSLQGKNNVQLDNYKEWLQEKNFTVETIKNYLGTINQYGDKEINTSAITNFLRENLIKYEPATLRSKRNALASYSKFQKINIDWEKINRLIPSVQRKLFPTINYQDLEKLKQVNTKTDKKTNERNRLILDFLFYTGLRINELINIRNCDYQKSFISTRKPN